ncbi:MAG: IPTL-CTERM sorting domain-containing protein, partial [Desulfobacterales bacterium]
MMSASAFAQVAYEEDFEGLDPTSASALGDSGWLGFATVFADYPGCSTFAYNYGAPFPAPNGGPGFSSVVTGATGQAINVYSDYNNGDHGNGLCIEASVFQEVVATAADAGDYVFSFDTQVPEPPNDVLGPDVTTFGFVKLLDPNNNFNADIFIKVDTSTAGAKSIPFTLDATADGKILQWGFASTASNFEATGRWYDNVEVALQAVEPPIEPPIEPPVEPPQGPVEGIPTLDQWGLLLLVTLLGGLGLVVVNRRG